MQPSLAKEPAKKIIYYFALTAAVITIPFPNNLNSKALIFFTVVALLQRPASDIGKRLKRSFFWVVSALYALWLASSIFWDVSGGYTFKNLEGYASFLFIPMVIAAIPTLSPGKVRKVCMAFVMIITAVCLTCLVKAFIEYQAKGDYRVFYYHYLGQQVGLNAIFLSNYCFAAITWLIYFRFLQNHYRSLLSTVLIILDAAFLIFMVYLLSSKLGIFFLLALLLFFIVYLGIIKKRLITSLIVLLIIITSGAIAIKKLYYLNWRVRVTEFKKYEGSKDDQNGLAIRLLMWNAAIELIKEKPVLGYGIKGTRQEVLKKYEEKNFKLGLQNRYNSHNQFLETTLMGGTIAFLILLLLLIMASVRSIRKRNLLLGIMLLHFICQSQVESTLEVQKELVFFLFFISLFYYHPASTPGKDYSAISSQAHSSS